MTHHINGQSILIGVAVPSSCSEVQQVEQRQLGYMLVCMCQEVGRSSDRGGLGWYTSVGHHRAWLDSRLRAAVFCAGGGQSNATCRLQCRPPAPACCSPDCPCREGAGHCGRDADCAGSLVCGRANCGDAPGRCCEASTPATARPSVQPQYACTCGAGGRHSPKIFGGVEVSPVKSYFAF